MNEHIRRARQVARLQPASKEKADELIQKAAYEAIEQSIIHRNVTPANELISDLSHISRRRNAQARLIAYLERWGNLASKKGRGFAFHDRHDSSVWTEDYKSSVKNSRWTEMVTGVATVKPRVRDVDEELRDLIGSLQKHDARYLAHRNLLGKLEEVLYAYGSTDECARERKRKANLFDQSTAMATTRATKFAKQRPDTA